MRNTIASSLYRVFSNHQECSVRKGYSPPDISPVIDLLATNLNNKYRRFCYRAGHSSCSMTDLSSLLVKLVSSCTLSSHSHSESAQETEKWLISLVKAALVLGPTSSLQFVTHNCIPHWGSTLWKLQQVSISQPQISPPHCMDDRWLRNHERLCSWYVQAIMMSNRKDSTRATQGS